MKRALSKKELRNLGVSIYIDKNGRLKVGCKKGVSRKRFQKDPAFARARENAREFGRAGRMSSRVKQVFAPWVRAIGGPHIGARLTRVLMQVIQSDTRNARGHRCVADGDLRCLEGFEFNAVHQPPDLEKLHCRLLRSVKGDRMLVKTDAFSTGLFSTSQVNRATHFNISLLVAALPELQQGRDWCLETSSGSMLAGEPLAPSLELAVNIDPMEKNMVFIVALAVRFYRFTGNESLPCDEGKHDLLRLVKAFSA